MRWMLGGLWSVFATLNHVLMEVDGSDYFQFFSWVMAVGEPGVNLPGCIIFGWFSSFVVSSCCLF